MPVGSAIAIYLLFWSLTLFVVLPLRVQTTHEAGGDLVPGQADSAPHDLRLWWRIKWTTIISSGLFLIFWANYDHEWLTLADLPFVRRPERS